MKIGRFLLNRIAGRESYPEEELNFREMLDQIQELSGKGIKIKVTYKNGKKKNKFKNVTPTNLVNFIVKEFYSYTGKDGKYCDFKTKTFLDLESLDEINERFTTPYCKRKDYINIIAGNTTQIGDEKRRESPSKKATIEYLVEGYL